MWKVNMIVIIGMAWGLFAASLLTALRADARKKGAKETDTER